MPTYGVEKLQIDAHLIRVCLFWFVVVGLLCGELVLMLLLLLLKGGRLIVFGLSSSSILWEVGRCVPAIDAALGFDELVLCWSGFALALAVA